MNSKDLVRSMINFLKEYHDMDCEELRKFFTTNYCMSEDDAEKIILELTMLQIFSEHFGVKI